MRTKTSSKRVLFGHALRTPVLGLFVVLSVLLPIILRTPVDTYAATSSTLNFQARLESSTGAIVPDGDYNVQFKLYSASTGGAALWTETYYDSNGATAGNDNRVSIRNGYLTVNLGSQTSFPGTINWDQDLWLTMNVGGTTQTASPTYDGEMNPRLKLTAVPYAFAAGKAASLEATTGGFLGQLDFSTLTADRKYVLPDTSLATTASPGTICVYNGAASNCPAASGSAYYIQNDVVLQPSSNFNIQARDSTTNGTVAGVFRGAAGGQTVDLVQFQGTSGTVLAAVTAGGDLQVASNIDTRTSTDLNIGTTNATAINLKQNTTIASGKTLTVQGAATFQNATDSTSAFAIKNAGGTSLVAVDTINSRTTLNSSLYLTDPTAGRQYSLRVDATDGQLKLSNNTIGNAIIGTQLDTSSNDAVSTAKFNSRSGGQVSAINIYIDSVPASPNNLIEMGIYADNAGSPVGQSRLANSNLSGTALTTGWNRIPLTSPITLSANTTYWFAWNVNSASTAFRFSGTSGNDAVFNYPVTFGASGLPATFGTADATQAWTFSVYAAYDTVTNQTYSGSALSVDDNNGLTVRPLTDGDTTVNASASNAAFRVQNAAGTSTIFTVDTTNNFIGANRLQVGGVNLNYGTYLTNAVGGTSALGVYLNSATTTDNIATFLALNAGNPVAQLYIKQTGSLEFASTTDKTISINQAASGTGKQLTISAGQGAAGSAGGNLLLQAGANGTASGTPGSVIVKANGGDSANAFQVQDAAGGTIFKVDTATAGASVAGTFQVTGASTLRGLTIDSATATNDTVLLSITSAGSNSFAGTITNSDLTAARTWTLPDASGTFAVSASGNIALSAAGDISFTGQLPIANGGTGANTAAGALTNLGAAASGANSDITSLSGLTTALSITQGGTGATTSQAAINNISQLTTQGDLLYFDGSNSTRLARGTTGQCLTSNATTILWGSCVAAEADTLATVTARGSSTGTAVALQGGATIRGITIDTATATDDTIIMSVTTGGSNSFAGTFTASDLTAARTWTLPDASGTFAVSASGNIALSATGDISFTGQLPVANGGTGSNTASGARTNLGAAASGANSDITSLSGLTTALSIAQGGTGATTSQAAINNISQLTTQGDLLFFDGSNSTRLARGTNGQCLTSNATTVLWGSCGLSAEADTLATVTARGSSTGTAVQLQGGATVRGLTIDTATATDDTIILSVTTGGIATFAGTITNNDLTAARTWTLPDASGTFAVSASGNIALSATGDISFTGQLPVANGGTGSNTASGARTNLGAAASGANSDITSLSGLTTALSITQGGTGATTAAGARTNLQAAASGANSDITSLSGLTTALSIAQGGSGATTSQGAINNISQLTTQGDLLYFDGTNTTRLARGTNGQCLNATATSIQWGTCGVTTEVDTLATVTARGATTSTAVALQGGATIRGITIDTATATDDTIIMSVTTGGANSFAGTITANDLTAARTWTLPNASGTFAVSASGNIALSAAGDITFTGQLPVANGGTGSNTASGARTNLGAAASGANSDITSLSGLTTALSIAQGGTGATTSQGAINNISQLTTQGDLLYFDGTNSTRLARGTNGQCLTSNATTLLWGACGITAEADTLATVTARGATTNTAVSLQGGATINGGAVSIQGNAASSVTTSSGALTITSAAAATWSTAAGVLTVQGYAGLTLDTGSAAAITIGATNANAINLGNTSSNIATTITGTTLIKPSTGNDSTTAFQIQNAAGRKLLTVNSTASTITLGNVTATAGQGIAGSLLFADGTNDNFALTLNTTTLTANRTITLPDASGTICIQGSSNCGFAASSGNGNYIQNQYAAQQASSDFWISGTGRADTRLFTPILDTATSVALNIGTANANAVNIGNTSSNIATTVTGTALFKPSTGNDSTTAFQIQSAGTTKLLNVDTTNLAVSTGTMATKIGYQYVGGTKNSGAQGFILFQKFTTGSAGTLNSISTYIGASGIAPNNKYKVAIYSNQTGTTCGGAGAVTMTDCPGTLIASTGDNTVTAWSWNTAAISASLSASTKYWMAYTQNGTAGDDNTTYFDVGSYDYLGYNIGSYGSWPASFSPGGTLTGMYGNNVALSMNVSVSTLTDGYSIVTNKYGNVGIGVAAGNSTALSIKGLDGGYATALDIQGSTLIRSNGSHAFEIQDTSTVNTMFSVDSTNHRTYVNGSALNTYVHTAALTVGPANSDSILNLVTSTGAQALYVDASGDVYFGSNTNHVLGMEARSNNAAGRNLTVSAGAAGTGGSAFSGGTLYLQGGSAAGTGNANGGSVSITGGNGTGTGVIGLVNLATTAFNTSSTQSFGASGSLTSGLVDTYSTIPVTATASGLTVTIPSPQLATIGRVLYVSNVGATYDFNISLSGTSITIALKPNTTATLIWNGNGWTAAGASSSTDLQSAYNNTLTSAGGAEIVLNPSGGAADGFTIRNNGTTPISGGILEVQSNIGTNLFSVNNYGTELAANGGAETSSTFSTNWTAAPAGGTITRTTTSGEYVTGLAGTKVVTAGTNYGVTNNLSANPVVSTTYQVSFTAKLSSGTFSTLQVLYSRDGGTNTAACTNYSTQTLSTSIWTKITCTITTDSTTATNPDLIIRQTDATSRTFWIDNLSFIRNDSTTQPSNVQVGGGINGGPITLFTLDRSTAPPVANGDTTYLGSMYYDITTGRIQCYEADGWGACGSAPDNIITLTPEYTGAVLNGTGVGTLTSDFCSNEVGVLVVGTLCSTHEVRNFYKWTSPQATSQTYSIYVNYKLPSTFKAFNDDNTIKLTGLTDSTTNGSLSYEIYRKDVTGNTVTQCGTTTTVTTSANTWQQVSANGNELSTCTWAGGDYIIFKINVTAKNNANVYVENLDFTYTNK